jgi:L-ascorbate metabolism protein UlaG (beta-lactamase superfamily)
MRTGNGHEGGNLPFGRKIELWRKGLASSLRRYSAEALLSTKQGTARLNPRANKPHHNQPPHHPDANCPVHLRNLTLADDWHAAVASSPDPHSGLAALAWLGHCSVLLRLRGQTILTDPVFSPQVGIRLGPLVLGPRRLAHAPLIHQLPPIDLILISHAHFDHLDKPTLKALANSRTRVITAAATGKLIPRGFADVLELPWDASTTVNGLDLTALRPRHWGARTGWDRHRGFNSYLINTPTSSPTPHRTLFAGDSAFTDNFAGLGPIDLAILGIGAYDPWEHAHATPEQALAMAHAMPAKRLLPVHHSTFKLSNEPLHEPMQRLLKAAGTTNPTTEIIQTEMGQVWRST